MLYRKKMIDDMGLTTLVQLPDDYIEALYEYHNKKTDPNNKENILLEFINCLFEINNAEKIDKLEKFAHVSRDNLIFDTIPKHLSDKIYKIYGIIIKKTDDDNSCGSICIKNMVKQLENYDFISVRKDIFVTVEGVKKKKPIMLYSISKKLA